MFKNAMLGNRVGISTCAHPQIELPRHPPSHQRQLSPDTKSRGVEKTANTACAEPRALAGVGLRGATIATARFSA